MMPDDEKLQALMLHNTTVRQVISALRVVLAAPREGHDVSQMSGVVSTAESALYEAEKLDRIQRSQMRDLLATGALPSAALARSFDGAARAVRVLMANLAMRGVPSDEARRAVDLAFSVAVQETLDAPDTGGQMLGMCFAAIAHLAGLGEHLPKTADELRTAALRGYGPEAP